MRIWRECVKVRNDDCETRRGLLSSRQCVTLTSNSNGSLSNTRLPSSPGICKAQVRSRRSLVVLKQDKVGYANIFKVIFVHQMPKSEARPRVAVHLEAGQKTQNAASSYDCAWTERRVHHTLMLVCNDFTSTTKHTSGTHARECCARGHVFPSDTG